MIKDAKDDNMGRFFCPHAVLSDLFQAIANSLGFNMDKNIDNLSANIMTVSYTHLTLPTKLEV